MSTPIYSVGSALRQLILDVNCLILLVDNAGEQAFANRDYGKTKQSWKSNDKLRLFRKNILLLSDEWNALRHGVKDLEMDMSDQAIADITQDNSEQRSIQYDECCSKDNWNPSAKKVGIIVADANALIVDSAQDLEHTIPIEFSIANGSKPIDAWYKIMFALIEYIKNSTLNNTDQLIEILRNAGNPAEEGYSKIDGYEYNELLGLSIQRRTAPAIWESMALISTHFRIQGMVKFKWKNTGKTRHRGRIGYIQLGAKS